MLSGLAFTSPFVLLALVALPLLWLLLRAIPPAPIRERFPAVVLLLGLEDRDNTADRTPFWLLLMRMLVLAVVIVGLAGPVLNERVNVAGGQNRLLVMIDGTWASARDWSAREAYLQKILARAGRDEKAVALLQLTDSEAPKFEKTRDALARLPSVRPMPWQPARLERADIDGLLPEGRFDTFWMSDGVRRDDREAWISALEARGSVTVIESAAPLYTVAQGETAEALLFKRMNGAGAQALSVKAIGLDPSGQERELEQLVAQFESGGTEVAAEFDLPVELASRISRFELIGQRHAGAVLLTDDRMKRRKIGIAADGADREGLELLSPEHYLTRALQPTAELLRGTIEELVSRKPDVLILADVSDIRPEDEIELLDWVNAGGALVRFAGPRVASEVVERDDDPLLPVQLRAGGRSVGGAMSWGTPKKIAPFERNSPFYGLEISEDLQVSAQVVAQPGPELAERTIASLQDGTPLVTRKTQGEGQIVMFHISANAEWSNVPLSGLFLRMLERLSLTAASRDLPPEELAGTVWTPIAVLDGFGRLQPQASLTGVDGARLVTEGVGPNLRAGLYRNDSQIFALNVVKSDQAMEPMVWPSDVQHVFIDDEKERDFAGFLLGLGLMMLAVDVLATLALTGRLLVGLIALVAMSVLQVPMARAQTDGAATSDIVLAHVLTGDTRVDEVAQAGLIGLSDTLSFRTSVEPNMPQGVDVDRDDLTLFPLIYWPVTESQKTPSAAAYEKLNAYLRSGGMILFDTRDANLARHGAVSPNGKALKRLAAGLVLPSLEPVPEDHVLTRAFYLLHDFPGRHAGGAVWLEAAPRDVERAEGMPFRNLNDGVTPVVIGGNDWAAAWAIDTAGQPLLPVGRGLSGERQRELALRFGVNLVMHVLTGNYKSDQVHVPALLERLGQ